MAYYHDMLKKIKEKQKEEFMRINYNEKIISLKVIDDSDDVVSLLSMWRKKYRNMFATVFEVTEKRTKKWIKEMILENPNSILFIIYVDGKIVGNIGIDKYNEKENTVELENYMKDPNFDFPGLMTIVDLSFLKWVFKSLKLSKIVTHIFSDNYKMLNVHARCGGWITTNAIPLKRVITYDGWKWQEMKIRNPDEIGERYFHELELTKENFMKHCEDIDYEVLDYN